MPNFNSSTAKMRTSWTDPVMLIGRSGNFWLLSSTEEAYACLTKDWPASQGPAFLAALDICSGASEGSLGRDLARFALLQAASEAGVAVRSLDITDEVDQGQPASEGEIERRVEEDR
jgi:hypothetical protein